MKQKFSETEYPKISVVVPTYNRKKDLLECLDSVQKLNYPNYETIVVDNGSTDKTAEAVRRQFPNVKLLVSDTNLGVTGGRNLGARNSDGEYIFFLDHDTIVDRDALSELVNVMQSDHRIGLAGAIIYYYDNPNYVWAAGGFISLITGKNWFNRRLVGNGVIEVQVLPTAFLVKREVIDKIGLFDDIYFATYEDTDFCFRAIKAGYRIVCVSTAKVWHKVPFSDNRKDTEKILQRGYYVARNKIVFMRKHAKPLHFITFLFIYPIYAIYYTVISLRFRRVDCLLSFWSGIISGLSFAMRYKGRYQHSSSLTRDI